MKYLILAGYLATWLVVLLLQIKIRRLEYRKKNVAQRSKPHNDPQAST